MPRSLRRTFTRVAPLEFEGRELPLTLPGPALRLSDDGPVQRYLVPGTPEFEGARPPWRYVERMGAAYRLEADGVWLNAIVRPRGPLFTEVRLALEPAVAPDPGREPRMGRLGG